MRLSTILLFILTLMIVLLAGCGGSDSVPAPAVSGPDSGAVGKSASSTFTYFFQDTVGNASAPLWNVSNGSGTKYWLLSNTCYSAPKAWVIGQNYFNNEYDTLTSDPFTVPANRNGIRFAFYTRFSVASGDFCYVMYSINGAAYQTLATYTGANASYPGWDKYSYSMPNSGGSAETWRIRYVFTSNGSGNDWGYGIDSVTVYQTNLNPPSNLTATDGTISGQVDLDWDANNAGTLTPDSYLIYRAPDNGGVAGTYTLLNTIAYPTTAYSDPTGNGNVYWYKVKARKANYTDSTYSNQNSGYGIGIWTVVTADATGSGSQYTSLAALASGKPAISFQYATGGNCEFAYSSQADGSSGWTSVAAETPNDVGYYTSLAIVNGKPAIAYFDNTNFDLRYAYSSQADGSAGWTALAIDQGGNVGFSNNSLATLASGSPAIGYRDFTNADLKYAYSSSADGSGGWTAITVDSTGDVGEYPSLALVNGKPAMSYFDGSNGDLKYAYSSQANGSSGWTAITVDSTGTVGADTSLKVINGHPAIAYQDTTNTDLKYVRSTTVGGTQVADWTPITVVATADNVGDFLSLALINGKPAISYHDTTNGALKYASSSTATGGSVGDWSSVTVDASDAGTFNSLALINGKPAISYRNTTLGRLYYAYLQ